MKVMIEGWALAIRGGVKGFRNLRGWFLQRFWKWKRWFSWGCVGFYIVYNEWTGRSEVEDKGYVRESLIKNFILFYF